MSKSEERALTIVCPACRAGVGRPCQHLTSYARHNTLARPHKERIAKAKEAR